VPALTVADADALTACIAGGGVAVFPADTVYGLACDPESERAVARLYELKGRPSDKPAAVMWFDREWALAALPELGPRTREAFERLTPGPVTLLVPNSRGRFPLAGGSAGEGGGAGGAAAGARAAEPASAHGTRGAEAPPALGVRIPKLTGDAEALHTVPLVVLQSSANHAGGPDAKRIEQVPEAIRQGADLVLDAGPLPGTPSTVIDLRDYERNGAYAIVRAGALTPQEVARALGIVGGP
jgi:L-threonylcarbamoyladenylate synthase